VADREPTDAAGRLTPVTPRSRPLDEHAQHDRWLVVRAASHDTDLTAAESADARALLARCDECAALAADITTITRATAESITPARPRDFRLTPAQAEGARGGFLDRLGRWLASPRGAVVRPLAGATLAIGIVLVAVGPTIRSPLAPQPQPPIAGAEASAPAQEPTVDPALTMEMQLAAPSDDAAGISQSGPEMAADRTAATNAAGSESVSKATAEPRVADIQALPGATADPDTANDAAMVAAPRPSSDDDTSLALTLLGIVLVGTALLVLLLTWLARRMPRHEPLP
jgi:hypothetical protein